MNWTVLAVAVLTVSPTVACQKGYKPTDVAGVCVEVDQAEVNPTWVSDEKPPEGRMPSWQREGIVIVDAPNMAAADAKADQDRIDAEREGKKKAGIR